MSDAMTSQNNDLSSWDTLYMAWKAAGKCILAEAPYGMECTLVLICPSELLD
jgi:hypothetical protein